MLNEANLIARARRMDKPALAEIYDYYSPRLFRYAARQLGDRERAEDIVAETFRRFLHTLHRGGGPEKHLQAYLFRIAQNSISDIYRRSNAETAELHENLPDESRLSPGESFENALDKQAVRGALANLTPEQRQVIVLKFVEGWKNDEVAEALGKSNGAVKALQHRAIAALKRQLVREEEFI
ncbi:MAG: sigma-70 family RNA polymerase sigma factor [Anaerolineales bacterium]|nr:sigma-70 family RNA polymerase sigma factor [Anaerolineales bacterium]